MLPLIVRLHRLLQAFPHRRTHFLILGLVAGTAGFIGSAFVTEVRSDHAHYMYSTTVDSYAPVLGMALDHHAGYRLPHQRL
jgi:hypothetical protein